jgi:hypothetical protein
MCQLRERPPETDWEVVMARLARRIGRGHNAIYHGTRHLPLVLRTGKLVWPDFLQTAVFFSRSPEVAAYWATMMGSEADQFSGGVLVLDRTSLAQNYRLKPSRYGEGWADEREESIWERAISFRRHLIGVVREADVDTVLGPAKHWFYPPEFYNWPERRKNRFYREAFVTAQRFTATGRRKVRSLIIQEREQLRPARRVTRPSGVGNPLKSESRSCPSQTSRKVARLERCRRSQRMDSRCQRSKQAQERRHRDAVGSTMREILDSRTLTFGGSNGLRRDAGLQLRVNADLDQGDGVGDALS